MSGARGARGSRGAVAAAAEGSARRRTLTAVLGALGVVVLAMVAVVALLVVFSPPTPGTATAGDDVPVAGAPRNAVFSFGHTVGNTVPSPDAEMDASQRLPFELAVAPDAFRIRIENRQYNAETTFDDGVRLTGLWIGDGGVTEDGTASAPADGILRPTGAYTSIPVELAGPVDVGPGGFVTDWITPDQYALGDGIPYLLSMGWTAPAGATLATYPGLSWLATGAGSSASSVVSAIAPVGVSTTMNYFDISLEYSFSSDAPVLVSIGHSLNTPVNGKRKLFPTRGENTSWPQQWAAEHDAIAVNMASSGAVTTDFRADSTKWERFAGIDPQIVTIWAASNDLSDGHPFDEVQRNWLEILATVKSQWPDAAVYAMTEPPRGLTGSSEATRDEWNEWMRSVPDGLSGVIDADALLRGQADPTHLGPLYDADGVHVNEAGHALIADAVPALPPVGGGAAAGAAEG